MEKGRFLNLIRHNLSGQLIAMKENKMKQHRKELLMKVVIRAQNKELYNNVKEHIKAYRKSGCLFGYKNSLGVDFATITQNIEGRTVTCQIWILYPDEKFKFMHKDYYGGAALGIIIGDDASKVNEMTSELMQYIDRASVIDKSENLINATYETLEAVIRKRNL